jgi:antitoxin ParD1/3/4
MPRLRLGYLGEQLNFLMVVEDCMVIALTPELEAYLENKVRSGRYLSADDVVREALRVLEERDRQQERDMADLRDKVAAGIAQLDRGEAWDLPDEIEEAVQEIQARARGRSPRRQDVRCGH